MKKRIKKVLFYLISLYLLFPFYIKVIAPLMSLAYYGLICAILILKFERAKEVILQSKLKHWLLRIFSKKWVSIPGDISLNSHFHFIGF